MRLFYSHCFSEDTSKVIPLCKELESLGHSAIIPADRQVRTHDWRTRLIKVLWQSDAAIFFITRNSLNSPQLLSELGAARAIAHTNRRFVLVPVVFDIDQPPDYANDLYPAIMKGNDPADYKKAAEDVQSIISDHLLFELAIEDTVPRVFIGHGRSDDWRRVSDHISQIGLRVVEYESISPVGKSVSGRLQEMLSVSTFAITVMSPEDQVTDGALRARQNVIHEVGLFQGKLGFERVVVLRHNKCEQFSNLAGINEITYSPDNWEEALGKLSSVLKRERVVEQ